MNISKSRGFLIAIVLFVVVLLSTAPIAIRYYLAQFLSDQGLHAVVVDDVDLNVFSGEVALSGVSANFEGEPVIALNEFRANIDWLPLFSKRVQIVSIVVDQLDLNVVQKAGQLRVGGLAIPSAEAEETNDSVAEDESAAWGVGVQSLLLDQVLIRYQDEALNNRVLLESLSLQDVESWNPDQAANIAMQAQLDNRPIHLESEAYLFSEPRKLSWTLSADALSVGAFKALVPKPVEQLDAALTLALQGELSQSDAQGISVQQSGSVKITDVDLQTDQHKLAVANTGWEGKQTLVLEPDQPPKYTLSGAIGMEALAVMSLDDALLSGFDQLSLPEVSIDSEAGLDLGQVTLTALRSNILRQSDGSIAGVAPSAPSDASNAEPSVVEDTAEAEDDTADTAMAFKISGFKLNDAYIEFADQAVKPGFEQQLNIKQLTMGALDSAKVNMPTPFELEAILGAHSTLTLNGEMQPLTVPPVVSYEGELKALELPPVSSYTQGVLGYLLKSGQVNAKLSMKLENNELDGNNALTLSHLTVERALDAEGNPVEVDLPVPLESGLSMLRDGDDNIKLDIPIKGNIDSPDFDVSSIIRQAVGKALGSASVTYLKYVLQPYGAILLAADLAKAANKSATAASLQPVSFAEGDAVLDSQALDYLPKLAKLLEERPKLGLTLCGVATQTERLPVSDGKKDKDKTPEAINEALLALADQRAEAVKDHLVNQVGISPDRLFVCHSKVDKDADAIPSVEIGL